MNEVSIEIGNREVKYPASYFLIAAILPVAMYEEFTVHMRKREGNIDGFI